MSTRVVSDVHKIDSNIQQVYRFLSDFNRMGMLMKMSREMAGEEYAAYTEKIEDIRTSTDDCVFVVKGIGEIGLKIVEREEPKLIKMQGDGRVPFEVSVWIQLLENGPYDTRLRITVEADLNMMMKMLLKGKLEKGINQLAEGLSRIPYMLIGMGEDTQNAQNDNLI